MVVLCAELSGNSWRINELIRSKIWAESMPRQKGIYDQHLADARERGLEISFGGDYIDADHMGPTLVQGPGVLDSRVYREETFGPVVALVPFTDDSEAVRLHNDSPYGLTASVFTRSRRRARSMAGQLRTGLVSINDIGATLHGHAEIPWGGVGESGFGRSHGDEGLLDATWVQVIEEGRWNGFEPKRPWWYPYDHRQMALINGFTELTGARCTRSRLRAVARLSKAAVAMATRSPRVEYERKSTSICRWGQGPCRELVWRANHPTERRAVWLKATVLRSLNGPQLAEAWCLLFDAERAWGGKVEYAPRASSLQDAPFAAVVGSVLFRKRKQVFLQGVVQTDSGPVSWSLQATPDERPLGQSLCLFPSRKMLEGRFPRNKSITPFAVQQLDGHIEIPEARWDVSGWTGMQGHNWGPAHAESYAWGHCSFADPGKAPSVVVEAVSARIKLGGWTTPLLSTMVVRRGMEEYRFDRLVDSWRQRSEMGNSVGRFGCVAKQAKPC